MKFIKLTSMIAGLFILFIILVAVCLITFVNPDRIKPLVAEQIKQRTGLQFTIDGDMSWILFPYLGVKVDHVILNNPPGFKQKIFAEMTQATIGMKLFPLLHKKIELSGIQLEGMTINLIRNAQGKRNWQFPLVDTLHERGPSNSSEKVQTQEGPEAPLAITVSTLDIEHSQINWLDEQKNKSIAFKQFSLHANNINLAHSFPMTLSFDFDTDKSKQHGHVELATEFLPDLLHQKLLLQDLHISSQFQRGDQSVPLTASGDVVVDFQRQLLAWTNFKGNLSNVPFIGQLNVSRFIVAPQLSAQFQVQSFDMKAALQALGHETTAMQTCNKVTGDIEFNATPSAVNAAGNFKIAELQLRHLKIMNIIMPLRYQKGLLDMSPVTGNLYQGILEAHIKINLNPAVPTFNLQGKLINIQTAQWLADWMPDRSNFKLNGNGDLHLELTSQGKDYNTWLKNLTGTGRFAINNGSLEGLNIDYLVHSARALLKHKSSAPSNNPNQMDFGSLQGTFQIHQGVLSNRDLLVKADDFSTQGKGDIDMITQTIDYSFQTRIHAASGKPSKNKHHLQGIVLPVTLKGPLMSPVISMDASSLAEQFMENNYLSLKDKPKLSKKLKKDASKLLKTFLN